MRKTFNTLASHCHKKVVIEIKLRFWQFSKKKTNILHGRTKVILRYHPPKKRVRRSEKSKAKKDTHEEKEKDAQHP
jgi:hypothetical protein